MDAPARRAEDPVPCNILDTSTGSSSPSPLKTKSRQAQAQPRSDFQSQQQQGRRASRQAATSGGLVFNPGERGGFATVDVQNAKSERRFSVGTDEGGHQKLVPLAKGRYSRSPTLEYRNVSPFEEMSELMSAAQDVSSGPGQTSMLSVQLSQSILSDQLLDAGGPLSSVTTGELFSGFLSADTVTLAYHTFQGLMNRCSGSASVCTSPSSADLPYRRIRQLGGQLGWRAQSVWNMFDNRAKREEYVSAPLRGKNTVVCGCGPVGLRTALELALLKANVTVLDKRPAADACTRINRLHLWEWGKQDIIAWGAKVFDPPGGNFGRDNDFCHIGIGELQLLLMKNAMLLGVTFQFEVEAKDLDEHSKTLVCKDGAKIPCDALVVVSGASSPLCRNLGFKSLAIGLRGKGSAIGVVANFKNNRSPKEIALRQFSWARQFNTSLFTKLEKETKVNLENVVYYKAQAHHYMVMTPTKRSLLDMGVLRDNGNLLHRSNVDLQRLSSMVQQIGGFFDIPAELCESQGAMIFDFSGVQRLENPALVIGDIFACAAGDALLEPFWPEGLGIVRGFMSALDAAWGVVLACRGPKEHAVSTMVTTFNTLKSVAAQTAAQCLQKDHRQYRLDPKTRYIMA